MSVARGTRMRMIIYEVDRPRTCRGFDYNHQGEFFVELNPSLPKVPLPCMLSFTVSDTNHLNQLVPQKDGFVAEEDCEYCRVRNGQIELDAHIMFSRKTKDMNEVYSPEYGWVSYPKRFFSCYTFDTLYKTYIKRDFSDEVRKRGLLFSICSADEIRQIEDTKKNSNHLQQLQEAENKRYNLGSMSPSPIPTLSQPPVNDGYPAKPRPQNQNRPQPPMDPVSQKEEFEKERKAWADKITLFLILELDNSKGRQDKGVAWAFSQRGLGLHTTFVHGNSEMLEVGRWYEGVCKWNRKFTRVYGGFYVEKIYRKFEKGFEPVETRFISGRGKVEIELEVNFTEDQYVDQPPARFNKVVLNNCQFNAVEVSKDLYKQYLGQRCKCRLINKRANNNNEITDWEITSIVEVLGNAIPEEARFSCSHARTDLPPLEDRLEEDEADIIPTGDGDGSPPVDDDDDDTLYLTKKPQKSPSMFTDIPNKDARHPQPIYPESARGNNDRQYDNYQEKAYSGKSQSNYSNNRGNIWTHMGYEVEGAPIPVGHALVVVASSNGAVIYANKPEGGILAVDAKLRQGAFISLEVFRLVHPQNGGLQYLARDGSIRPIPSPPQLRTFAIDGALFVDTECRMEYTRPYQNGYQLYSSDLGPVYSSDTLPHEEEGTVSISDIKNGGDSWRIWVQYHHYGRPNEHEGYRWEAMKVRGPQQQVDRYENEDLGRYFDDIDVEKQRNHFAEFGIGPASRQRQDNWDNRNGGYEEQYGRNDGYGRGGQYSKDDGNSMWSDGRNMRDEWRGEGSYRGNDGWNQQDGRNSARGEGRYEGQYSRNGGQYSQDDRDYGMRSPGGNSTMYSTQGPRNTEFYNDNTVPDNLFAQMWNLPEIRRCLKVADYDLYCEAETVMEKIKAKQAKNRSSNMPNDQYREWQDDNRSQYSRPASEMRTSTSGGMRENLRRAFHGEPSSSNSQRGGYDNYSQHDRRYD